MATQNDDNESEPEDFEAYEDKLDELNEGLLEAYAAGFSKAVEFYDVDEPAETGVDALRRNSIIQESQYYYWDGRTKPLKPWLAEQFGVDNS